MEDRPKGDSVNVLRHIAGFLRPYRLRIVSALVSLIVAAGAVLAIGQALRRVVDFGFSADSTVLDQYFLALLGVVALLAVATYGRYYAVSSLGERVVADIRHKVYQHVVGLSPEFFESTRTGEILSRLTTDTTLIQSVVGSSASVALRNMMIFAGGSILLIVSSPKLTGLVFLIVLLVVLPIVFFGRRVRRLSRESQDRLADVGTFAGESLDAVQTIQAFGREDANRRRFGGIVEAAYTTALRQIKSRALLTGIVILFVFGAVDIVLWIGARDVISGAMTGGQLAAFVFYAVMVAGSVGSLSEVYGDFQRAAGATERLMELLGTSSRISAPESPVSLPRPARGAIRFDRVTFRYPARPGYRALASYSLSVSPGERLALVGPSGAGKTTVFQLLLRFYDPESGRVSIDGTDLRDARPEDVRQHIGLVPQDPVIFADDVWSNIRYGRPEATDREVRAAAEAAAAAEFVERLPDGYGTFLGDRGTQLSGGQRQRISIARAILRNPTILLLDEATSALDAENERVVQRALETLMEGRTTLVIAHSLATVLKADRIVVMDAGDVVANGTHAELMAQGGLYARLAQLQFETSEDADTVAAAQ
ncbi:MAG: ABC transporter transmembrane domain-containing protein [Rhodospirillaceae bacterium]|nr:ABC transporter transmembrane domain-containing protein [Rhodospirillaceae bacterium]